jgi:predicted transposase YdaD
MSTTTLHDRLFKEFFHRFLPDFLNLFFPDKATQLNFNTLTFLDKELIINLPDQLLRIPDIVAEVETHNGQPEVIIVHIEVEGRDKNSLPQRIFEYYTLLRALRQKSILPIALVLLPKAGGLRWQSYHEQLFGEELIHFRYGQVGIRSLPSQAYLASGDPVAATLATLMKSARDEKAAVKFIALQTVMNSQLSLADQLYLVNLIQTYLPQNKVPIGDADMMTHLAEAELTWSERIAYQAEARGEAIGEARGEAIGEARGEARGKAKGEIKGKRELLLRLLALRFGPLPTHLLAKLNSINQTATFDQLSEHLLTAPTLADFTTKAQLPEQPLSLTTDASI